MKGTVRILVSTVGLLGLILITTEVSAWSPRHDHRGGAYPCGGANGPCGAPSHHRRGYYPCGGANGPCGGGVVIAAPPRVFIAPPTYIVGGQTYETQGSNISSPIEYQRQGGGPQLVTPPPQPRLRQVNVSTTVLMEKARIVRHTYGKPTYPDDLRPGEAVIICNAASGAYMLESERHRNGHSYHKQQCWRYDNPLDGPPVEEEIYVK